MGKFFKKVARAIVKGFLCVYCKIIYRFELIGTENIPKQGAIIICGNHRSFIDPPLIEVTCKRYTRFLAKEELTKNKFMALLGKIFDVILVKRNSKDVKAMKESLQTLKDGYCLVLFPEGTRNGLKKGTKVKDGAAFFALRTGTNIIPVGISGGEKLFRKIRIKYGKAIDLSNYQDMYKNKETEKQAVEEASELIMNSIIELTK